MSVSNSSLKTDLKPIVDFWYGIRELPNDILWFREIFVDNYAVGDSWLIKGSEMNLLVDTCSGIVPIAPLIESIGDKPVLAVAMNDSYDHCGGWFEFKNRACHPIDAIGLNDPSEQVNTVSDYLDDDRLFALPYQGYTTRNFELVGAKPTRLFNHGDNIALGNREIEVIHTPGRGQGGICLWEKATATLFTSDMLYDGDHGLAWPPSEPKQYIDSLNRLRSLPAEVVYPGHYGPFNRQRMLEIISDQISNLTGI
jgi:glyoxylase-like metal-dependent hydrolase (beta-lactamase superfamily II)